MQNLLQRSKKTVGPKNRYRSGEQLVGSLSARRKLATRKAFQLKHVTMTAALEDANQPRLPINMKVPKPKSIDHSYMTSFQQRFSKPKLPPQYVKHHF
jgi:hypothetical protein